MQPFVSTLLTLSPPTSIYTPLPHTPPCQNGQRRKFRSRPDVEKYLESVNASSETDTPAAFTIACQGCGATEDAKRVGERWTACDECSSWHHSACLGRSTDEKQALPFVCIRCTQKARKADNVEDSPLDPQQHHDARPEAHIEVTQAAVLKEAKPGTSPEVQQAGRKRKATASSSSSFVAADAAATNLSPEHQRYVLPTEQRGGAGVTHGRCVMHGSCAWKSCHPSPALFNFVFDNSRNSSLSNNSTALPLSGRSKRTNR